MLSRAHEAAAQVGASLGLSNDDAALYLHLCVNGRSKVGDIAEALGTHRNEIYRAMSRLAELGIVRATDEKPARYEAVDPEQVFDLALASRLRQVEALRRSREEVVTLLSRIEAHAPAPESTYRMLRGRTEILKARRQMIEGAKRSLLWVSTSETAVPVWVASGEMTLAARRAAEGLELRALLKPFDGALEALGALRSCATAQLATFAPTSQVGFLLADERELIMYVVNDASSRIDAEEETAIHTTAAGFVQAERAFFEQAWQTRTPLFS